MARLPHAWIEQKQLRLEVRFRLGMAQLGLKKTLQSECWNHFSTKERAVGHYEPMKFVRSTVRMVMNCLGNI